MEINNRITISKESPKRGMDQKIPQIGSSVKRKRLSDITNMVGPTRSTAQIQENPKEIACAITKECVSQLLEENVTLLKTIGERNKLLEVSSIELQKLRVVVEKANVQNRTLAQANSQMFAELTTSKDRLKALQHELGCIMAVVKLKNKELDEKEKLIKELRKMIMVEEERSKHIEVALDAAQFERANNGDSIMEKNPGLEVSKPSLDKGPNGELHEKMGMEVVAADALVSNTSNNTTCNIKKRAVRNKHTVAVGSNASTNQEQPKEKSVNQLNQHDEKAIAEEELHGGLCEGIRTEEHSQCVNPTTTDASLPNSVDSNINCGPNRKRILRSRSLGPTTSTQAEAKEENNTTLTQLEEAKEKNNTRTSIRRSNIRKPEPLESKDHSTDIADTEIPGATTLTETKEKINRRTSTRRSSNTKAEPLESKDHLIDIADTEILASTTLIETKEKTKTRRTSARRLSDNRQSEPLESKAHLFEMVDFEIPACSLDVGKEKNNTRRTSSRRLSNNRRSESLESKDHLFEIVDPELPACSLDEEQPVQAESSATLTEQVEQKEKDDIGRRTSSQRSLNSQRPETHESKDSNETVTTQLPACSPVVESPSEVVPLHGRTSAPCGSDTSVKLQEDPKEQNSSSQCHDQESRRISVGRPTRRAAEKVSSYKEHPLNVKMRRPE